jgi:hypothetical protein
VRLTFRATTPADFPAGLDIIRDRFVYDEAARECLPGLWSDVLKNRCGTSAVVEDADRPTPDRIAAFGLSIFVTDELVHEAKTVLSPYIGPQILERWTRGHSPILTPEAIRRATEGDGLNVLTLHYGCRTWDYSPEDIVMVYTMLLQSSLATHRPYRLKELIMEVYGQELSPTLNSGLSLRTDYAGRYQDNDAASPNERAYLCGVTRQEALGRRGTFAATFLLPAPTPRFRFADRERDLLRHAINGATDGELARMLFLSPITIKKRWEHVYRRVAGIDPELLPKEPFLAPSGRRGLEKRRRLLTYLRSHPEEMEP